MVYETTTAAAIKQLRQQLNLTLEEFGKRIGKSRAHVCHIEKGRKKPSSEMAWRIVYLAREHDIPFALELLIPPPKRNKNEE